MVGFLRVLLHKISGLILLIWDGSPIHWAQEIKAFLKREAAKRLHREQLPGSAPDLTPDEGIWKYREAASNWAIVVVPTRDYVHRELIRARECLRHKREILWSKMHREPASFVKSRKARHLRVWYLPTSTCSSF